MKIAEILKEFQEYLDTNTYGSWMNSNTREILPVNFHKHYQIMSEYMNKIGEDGDPYRWAINNHWIRIVHIHNEISISAKYEDIKKVWGILRPQLLKQEYIVITFKDSIPVPYVHYDLPDDRENLINFTIPEKFHPFS